MNNEQILALAANYTWRELAGISDTFDKLFKNARNAELTKALAKDFADAWKFQSCDVKYTRTIFGSKDDLREDADVTLVFDGKKIDIDMSALAHCGSFRLVTMKMLFTHQR